MNGFLNELGKKVAERWMTLLVLPGLVYLAVLVAAHTMHGPFDLAGLRTAMDRLAAKPAASSPGVIVLVASGALALAALVGLTATALGRLVESLWLIEGRRRPARLLTIRRLRRWRAADTRVKDETRAAVRAARPTPGTGLRASTAPGATSPLGRAIAARNAIGLVEPRRPTWMGDRLLAADRRLLEAYDLDLVGVWPRLWLIVPEETREELVRAREALGAAARLTGWGVLYLLLGWMWWPALPIGAAVGITGWARARGAVVCLADLVESTADLYGRELAEQLGIPVEGRLSKEAGLQITMVLRKDSGLRPSSAEL